MSKIKSSLNNILVILIYILIFFVLANLMNSVIDKFIVSKDEEIIVSLFLNVFIYIFMFISIILLMSNEIKTDFKILCKTSSINILYGSFLAMLCIYFGNFVGNIIATILGGIGDSANQGAVISMLTSKYGILFFFIVCFVGPFVEEAVFRKALHNGMRQFKIPTWLMLGISSLLFGLIHVVSAGDFEFIFLYIFSGLVFGYLEIYYKSIFPGLIVHIVNNTLSCVIVFLLEMVFDF